MIEARRNKAQNSNHSLLDIQKAHEIAIKYEMQTNPSPIRENAHFIAEFADERLPISVVHK